MATYDHASDDPDRTPSADPKTLWSGGLATALVAALVVLVGVVIARGLFDVPVMAPEDAGTWGDVSTGQLMLAAAGAALLATGLVHLLILTTPRALTFFSWIIGLITLAVTLAPFAQDAELSAQVASAAIYLVTGIAIGTLITSVARIAIARGARNARGDDGTPPNPDRFS